MKILMVRPGPHFSVIDVYRGWLKAFQGLGVNVVDLNYDERLSFYASAIRQDDDGNLIPRLETAEAVRLASKGIEAACYEFWPDVLFIVSAFFIPMDVLDTARAHGTKVVLLHTESPYEDDRQVRRAEHASLNILNDPTNLERFREVGAAEYLPHAYDPDVHCPGPVGSPDYVSDFCFVGTGYPSRIRFFEAIGWTGIDAALGGFWGGLDEDSPLRKFVAHDLEHCLDNVGAVDLYRATKASANLYRREAEEDDRPDLVEGWSMGPREVELAACGTFYLTEARGENRQVLPMIPTFDSPADFEQKLRWYLAHDGARDEISRSAREAVADRTFGSNARRLLGLIEKL